MSLNPSLRFYFFRSCCQRPNYISPCLVLKSGFQGYLMQHSHVSYLCQPCLPFSYSIRTVFEKMLSGLYESISKNQQRYSAHWTLKRFVNKILFSRFTLWLGSVTSSIALTKKSNVTGDYSDVTASSGESWPQNRRADKAK